MTKKTNTQKSTQKISYFVLDKFDVKEVVEIHNCELKISVLTLFGSAFLRRMYLVLLKEENWGFVAKLEGNIVGFIFATKPKTSFFKCLSIIDVFFFLINSIRNPIKFISFLNVLKEFYMGILKNRTFQKESLIELFNFAIKKDYKSRGIGSELIKKFEFKAKECGFSHVLTRTHNKKLSDYYIKNKKATVIKKIKSVIQGSIILKWKI